MPNFTKGKWVDCGDCTVGVENEDGTIKCWICECEPDYVHIEEENALANARLIAAAPEMYNELHNLLEYLYDIQSEGFMLQTQEDVNRVEALLARIDGEEVQI